MGFFSKVWNAVTGTDVVEDVFDKDNGLLVRAGGWVDGLSYTDQEKAASFAEMVEHANAFVKASLAENTERSRTRRSIAILWIRAELLLVFISLIAFSFSQELARYAWELASSDIMTYGTLAVLAFFFGAHILGRGIFKKPELKWVHSHKYGWAWHIEGEGVSVTNRRIEGERYACLFHAANWPTQLQGCISVGSRIQKISGRQGIENSKFSLNQLHDFLDPKTDHVLTITTS